jgi:sterol desaturase/sphingolipid hydroxylase (fatty acid hydroxylase superfamily)
MGVVVFLAIGVIVLRGLERLFPARDAAGEALRTKLFSRERLTDVAHVVFNAAVTQPLVKLAGLATFVAFVLVFRLPHDRSHLYDVWHHEARLSALPLLVQAPLAIVFADLAAYWTHRALHHGWLWRLHVVHHSSQALDWLAGARNHPAAEVLSTIAVGAALLVVGFDPRVLAVAAPLRLYGVLLHANVSFGTSFLRYVVATPLFHRWHHAHPDALPAGLKAGVNFAGLLPAWDLIFGTYHCPRGEQPPAFGADVPSRRQPGIRIPVPPRFVGQLAFPFRRDW